MAAFYQKAYVQAGLTTDLPDDSALAKMRDNLFRGTNKDFRFLIAALQELDVPAGGRVLDYGANWGYTSYQLQSAGYSPSAFEISVPRAAFGRKLGIEIATELKDQDRNFDVVFSSHVLEHVPSPTDSLQDQLDRVRPGGYVIGLTPNGSLARRKADAKDFHTAWGRVHPVLLSAEFLDKSFGAFPSFVAGRRPKPDELKKWAGSGRTIVDIQEPELFFVIRKY